MQDDAMFAALTVKETLMTAAHFQLSSKLSDEDKEKYVDSIIAELGLNKCKDTIIGDAKTRGVSGGERKRCNIGVELIGVVAIGTVVLGIHVTVPVAFG